MQPLSLYELNSLIRDLFDTHLAHSLWLQAELSEVREHNGHCYVEFVQKDAKGNGLVAKARGQIWARTWTLLRPHFEQTTGQRLVAGMQVLVEVEPTFHEAYGYALTVTDMDPTYTLGDIARRRREILQQLEREGVLTMNKELPLPRLLQRIAVISSATAAGFQDFERQLHDNRYRLAFHTRLFPAVMQGSAVEESIINALNAIAADTSRWDAVIIIRGGGSTADLNGFDTLALAENVAQFPIPIITGIGHERDDTVIDIVSHTRVKTPTAAAEFLIHHQLQEWEHIADMADVVSRCATLTLQRQSGRLDMLTQQTRTATAQMLLRQQHRLDLAATRIDGASPDRLLRLGFSITRVNGKAVTSAAQVPPGSIVTTTLADGTLTSVTTDTPQP